MRTLIFLALVSSGCVVVNQGEVGVRRVWGKLDSRVVPPGLVFYESVSTEIIKVPTRTVRVKVAHTRPSKEGLNVETEISILHRIRPDMAPRIIETIGLDYEDDLITGVFRSAAADVSARFLARDMYSAERTNIEREIREAMTRVVYVRGFEIEAVLMKSIQLPPGLARSIEQKLESEQQAQRMKFILEQEQSEAERKRVEATGIRDAQKIIADGLSPVVIQRRHIEALSALARSPNAKVVVTDGKAPVVVPPPSAAN